MKISTRGRYGLLALVDIAACGCPDKDRCVTIKNISQRQGISEAYLEQLISPLKKAGIVKSTRGAMGGYQLKRPAAEISVAEVLEVLEGSLYPVDCVSDEPGATCGSVECKSCVTKAVWEKLYNQLSNVLNSISIEDLANDYKQKKESEGNE